MINEVEQYLHTLGIDYELQFDRERRKANLVALIGPDSGGGLMLSGHSDVVPTTGQDWTYSPFDPTLRGDRLYGRGACDMKGFIAVVLALLPNLRPSSLSAPLRVVLTYDEEVGCHGAQQLAPEISDLGGGPPALCLVGEPTQLEVVDAHKGMRLLKTRAQGRSAHSSRPDIGRSAIAALARLCSALDQHATELRERSLLHSAPASGYACDHTTINLGRIAGGAAVNIVAEHAELEWELRYLSEVDLDEIIALVERVSAELRAEGIDLETQVDAQLPGLSDQDKAGWAARLLALCDRDVTRQVDYCTEAGIFQSALKTPTFIYGPGSINNAHREDEYVALPDLEQTGHVLLSLIDQVCINPY